MIGDVCTSLFSGGTPSTKNEEYWTGENRWLSSGETRNRFIIDTDKRISEAAIQESSTKLALKNDVVVATAGQGHTRGQVSFLKVDTYINQSVIALRANEEIILPEYLFYNLSSRYSELRKISDGASIRGSLSGNILKNIPIFLPSLEDQRKIVSILKPIDDKILLNEQINKNLMKQLQTLFCQFFLSNLESSSWSETTLDKMLLLRNEKVKAGNLPEYPYLPIDLIPTKNLGLTEVRPNQEAKSSLQLFRKNDILIGAMRVYFHRVSIAPFDGITRNTCFVLQPVTPKYLYYLLMVCFQDETIDFASRTSKGSTMPYAVWEDGLGKMPIKIPPDNLLSEFNAIAKPIVETIEGSFSRNHVLTNLRDELLPKLLSGEIELS